MTKLTEKQTAAMVTYLRGVDQTTTSLGGIRETTIAELLAKALESGMDLEEIKAGLTMRSLLEATMGSAMRAGLSGGYLAAINLVMVVLKAEGLLNEEPVVEAKPEFRQEYIDRFEDIG